MEENELNVDLMNYLVKVVYLVALRACQSNLFLAMSRFNFIYGYRTLNFYNCNSSFNKFEMSH